MDVNVMAEVKGVGVPSVTAVEREDRAKPQVAPVAGGGDSSKAAMNQSALHGEEKRARKPVSQEEAAKAVKDLQDRLDALGNTRLNFSLHADPNAVVVRVTDGKTGEVVKQIPTEEALKLSKTLNDLVGVMFDGKA